jgi:hypothetical protein
MARTVAPHNRRIADPGSEVVADTRTGEALNAVGRFVAVVAGQTWTAWRVRRTPDVGHI